MAGQLIPPPGLAPDLPPETTQRQSIAMWLDLMRACDKLVLAGLRRDIGPDGDLREAHRKWYNEVMDEHDRTLRHTIAELRRREKMGHDDGSNT